MSGQARTGWSISLCKVRGIPVRIHFSFFLLLLWIGLEEAGRGAPVLPEIAFIAGVFFCVLLHEFGHALTAAKFGVKTRDITLYPFGGIAALGSSPSPRAELVIAAAGPLVNFALAALIFPSLDISSFGYSVSEAELLANPGQLPDQPVLLMARLFIANIILGVFNLFPALPMDGGRILRASLVLLGVSNPTHRAARLSQVLSIGLMILALFGEQPVLFVIALLVFLGASQEQLHVRATTTAARYTVADVMTEAQYCLALPHGITISDASKQIVRSSQTIFPVMHGNSVLGLVSRPVLISAGLQLKEGAVEDAYISELMERSFDEIEPQEKLSVILDKLSKGIRFPLVVLDAKETFCGILERDRLFEFLMISQDQKSQKRNKKRDTPPEDE